MVPTFGPFFLVLASTSFAAGASTIMDRGAFASPKTGIKWRYWIEDAAVELDTLRFDISEMARVGSAGFELLNSVQIATGLIPPVILYSNTTSVNTSIPAVSLEPSQTTLFAITSATSLEGVPVPSARIVSADPGVIAVATNTSTSSSSVPVTIANLSLEGETSQILSGWELNVTACMPPADIHEHQSVLVPLPLMNLTQGLVPWSQIEGLANISGVGTYVTSFEWTHANDGAVGLLLDFGEILHTLKAWFRNGQQVTTADPTHPVVDISNLVIEGTNTIRVDAASTLLNVINTVPEVESLGQLRLSTTDPSALQDQQYGLISNITLVPYARSHDIGVASFEDTLFQCNQRSFSVVLRPKSIFQGSYILATPPHTPGDTTAKHYKQNGFLTLHPRFFESSIAGKDAFHEEPGLGLAGLDFCSSPTELGMKIEI
ncbi:hypothetical protein F5878DRAFT_655593 [Lentinula raphanica]|uniref:Uncharacterized protein n=1 Tax=Lentinula raphanica TaxID=153919 RepID=A0AA38PKT2_9AGAR|nr:hypothetical protein F5878DRAFT_655593 [Lentinula raphanica]